MFKLKIRQKINFALLGLSCITLMLFAYISLKGMEKLGNYALESSEALGYKALKDSISNLISAATNSLHQKAIDEASISNAFFEQVEKDVVKMVNFANIVWQKVDIQQNGNPSYSQYNQPDDIYSVSSYVLAPGVLQNSVYEELKRSALMDDVFISIYPTNPNLAYLYLGTRSGFYRGYPWDTGFDISYDPRRRPWYKLAESSNTIIWTNPYVDAVSKELVVTCAKSFHGLETNVIFGVVAADVTLTALSEEINNTKVGQTGYMFLFDREGNIIAKPGIVPSNTKWYETFKTQNIFEPNNKDFKNIADHMVSGQSGVRKFEVKGKDHYIAYESLKSTGWILAIIVPVHEVIGLVEDTRKKITSDTAISKDKINAYIGNVESGLLWIFIFMVFTVLGIAFWLSKRITDPILILNDGLQKVGKGNLTHKININTGDEIEILSRAFNKMTEDLQVYMKNLKDAVQAKEQAENRLKLTETMLSGIRKVIAGIYGHERDEYSFKWLIEYMEQELYKNGEYIFHKGDRACKLYYINYGQLRLVEINKVIEGQNIVGEMGILSADKIHSLTAVSCGNLTLYSMEEDKLIELLYKDPSLLFELIHVSINRLIENIQETISVRNRIESEIAIAHDIQMGILPKDFSACGGRKDFALHAIIEPAQTVGGDLYDFFLIEPEKLFFIIGDVSDKGIGAAIFMAITKTLFKSHVMSKGSKSLNEVFSVINDQLIKSNPQMMFVTMFGGILDLMTGEVDYVDAGHDPPFIMRNGRGVEMLEKKDSLALCFIEEYVYKSNKLVLNPGDFLVLYTDGLTDAVNKSGKRYKTEGNKKTLKVFNSHSTPEAINAALLDNLKTFTEGQPQYDDITVLTIQYKGKVES